MYEGKVQELASAQQTITKLQMDEDQLELLRKKAELVDVCEAGIRDT